MRRQIRRFDVDSLKFSILWAIENLNRYNMSHVYTAGQNKLNC